MPGPLGVYALAMSFVPTFVQRPSRKSRVVEGALVLPGRTDPSSWLRPDDPLPAGPFHVFPAKAEGVSLEKGVGWANAIRVPSVLIVRRSLAEPVLTPLVKAGDVILREVRVMRAHPRKNLQWKSEVMDDDFVLVDVRARFPADRAMLPESAWTEEKHVQYASLLEWVPPDATFGKGRSPRATMFRVGEQPSLLFTEKKLWDKLYAALGGALAAGEMGPRFDMLDAFTEPPFREKPAEAEAAANAFYKMFAAQRSNAGDRKRALASAIWSYWTARLVDCAASDDTRTAACKHPFYAYAYARDVDQAPHAVTRRGVLSDSCAAREYAVHVDREVNDTTRKALDHNATRVEQDAHENAERFRAAAKTSPAAVPSSTPSSTTSFVMLGFAPNGRGVVPGSFRTAGGHLHAPYTRLAPPPAVFVADEYGGKGRLRKQKSMAHLFALRDGEYGPIIVRRSVVLPLLAGLEKDVELVPAKLNDAKGPLDPDFALLHVKTYVPMDMQASNVKLAHAKAPFTGGVRLVHRLAWTEKTRPRARIFRVLQLPHVLMMDEELCAALEKATARAVQRFTGKLTSAHLSPLIPPPDVTDAKDEARARKAMDAFARYQARDAGDVSAEAKKDRAVALSHPLGALAFATAIDRGPCSETRDATLASADIALAYALLVDRGPHPLTRKAATKTPQATYGYVRDVDIGFHPLTRASFGRPTWSEKETRAWERELASVRRGLKANAPPALPVR